LRAQGRTGGLCHSKEKRHDRYIVRYGLVLSEVQLPLDIRVWKGGTADNQTVADTFAHWKQTYQAKGAIWVADRSMSDEPTLSAIDRLGLDYVTGLSGQTQKALLRAFHEAQPDLFDQPLSEVAYESQRYVLCRHQKKGYRRAAAHQRARRTVYEGLKAIAQSPHNKHRDKLYHRAMKLLERHGQTGQWSIDFEESTDAHGVTRWTLRFTLDRQAAQAIDAMGHYELLQTSLSGKAADSSQVQAYYKSLMSVERCFRMAKTSLEIRPIRHWKKRRITAHIHLNYLALWLVKYIEGQWRGLGYPREVVPTLRDWDQALRYTELLDKDHQTTVGYEWTQGEQARRVIEQLKALGELKALQPPV